MLPDEYEMRSQKSASVIVSVRGIKTNDRFRVRSTDPQIH